MSLTFQAAPRISVAQFAAVLDKYGSPCAPIAQECYEIITSSGIDPAVALAFFGRESVFGTRGITPDIKNWGNVRLAFRPERAIGQHPKNFAIYATWQDGLRDWCERINQRYITERGLDTVEKAVPVYAPSSDGNDVRAYTEHIARLVTQWVDEDQRRTPGQPSVDTGAALRDGLLQATFAIAGTSFRPDTAMHQFLLNETRAGRPLGNPIGEVQQITLNGQDYVMQVFAMDTLYASVQDQGKIYRLSDLLR